MDSLIEAFGTIKQKHALNSRRLNQVGNETLQEAVTKAAENIIDKKGISGKGVKLCGSVCIVIMKSLSSLHGIKFAFPAT